LSQHPVSQLSQKSQIDWQRLQNVALFCCRSGTLGRWNLSMLSHSRFEAHPQSQIIEPLDHLPSLQPCGFLAAQRSGSRNPLLPADGRVRLPETDHPPQERPHSFGIQIARRPLSRQISHLLLRPGWSPTSNMNGSDTGDDPVAPPVATPGASPVRRRVSQLLPTHPKIGCSPSSEPGGDRPLGYRFCGSCRLSLASTRILGRPPSFR